MSRCKSEGECRNPSWCRSADECYRDSVPKRADQPAPTPRTDAAQKEYDDALALHGYDIKTVWLCFRETERELSASRAEAERLKDRAEQAELDRDMGKAEVRRTTDEYVKTTREALAEAERLREALVKLKDAYIAARSGQEMTDEEISLAATVNHALAATRKEEGNG